MGKSNVVAIFSKVTDDKLDARLKELEENLATLKQKGIFIVSLSEYRRIVGQIECIKEEQKRRKELTYGQAMPTKIKSAPKLTLLRGKKSGGCSAKQRRRWLSLARK